MLPLVAGCRVVRWLQEASGAGCLRLRAAPRLGSEQPPACLPAVCLHACFRSQRLCFAACAAPAATCRHVPHCLLPSAGVIEMTKGQNLRALYGVCACAAQLAGARRSGGGGGDAASEEALPRLAADALQQQYALHCPAKLPLVRGMLKSQGLL